MKIGIGLKIDLTKIDKARIIEGKKGKYIDLTTFIDLEQQDQYGNNGFIAHSMSKDERAQGMQGSIVGNTKVFYTDKQPQQQQAPRQTNQPHQPGFVPHNQQQAPQVSPPTNPQPAFEDSDIPF